MIMLRPWSHVVALASVCCLAACKPHATDTDSAKDAAQSTQSSPLVSSDQPAKTSADAFAQERALLTMLDFESPDQIAWLEDSGASHTLQKSDDGNAALVLSFSDQHGISKVSATPSKPWPLAGLEEFNLALDVQNLSPVSTQFYVSIENGSGAYMSRSIALPASYKGTIYFPVAGVAAETETGLWGEEPVWHSEDQLMIWRSWRKDWAPSTQLSRINFFALGLLQEQQVQIDNVRLRANPKMREDWMLGIIDQYGQYNRMDSPLYVHSDAELKQRAEQELKELESSKGMPNRSRFGGYSAGPKLEATGFFRTEKVDGKWWMVDPDGYVFFSHGPANVRMANLTTITGIDFKDERVRARSDDELTPEDSMGIVKVSDEARSTRYVASELRKNMFAWLPAYDESLAKHYSYRRSTLKGPVAHGETYSFYRANLERRYGEQAPLSFIKKWHEVTALRMKHWGFTSFGNWVDPAFYDMEQVPYFANGWIIGNFKTLSGHKNHWGLMPDSYDPVFAERAEATIKAIADEVKASPWCVGIFVDNEKSWGEREGSVEERYGVILDALSKDAADSPAKTAFSNIIKQQYGSIEKLNQAWNTELASWQQFEKGLNFTQHSDALVADLSMLLEQLGEQYFKVVKGTLKRYLPNHLYMGARMANWGMPDEVIKASIKYSDALSFNIYEDGVQQSSWSFLEEVDLPVVIGEFHIGTATDSGLFNPGIVHASDQKDRARKYRDYMDSVLAKDYMVGAHWFQYVDEPVSGRALDGENANIGFVTVADIPYPDLIKEVQDFTSTMYQRRLDQK
ncbi:agarase [Agaribacterium haliotis]|uniref:agarase n=1 Tax=Agaribacterium haliotis TaxID=2013869 RepID=UPI001178547F|nr:agarase [Agaribacterium haliotis]